MRQRRANAADSDEPQEPNGHAASAPGVSGMSGLSPRLLMPGPRLYTTLVQHREAEAGLQADLQYVLDQKLRAAARQAPPSTPPSDFTAAVRASISRAHIAPPPAPPTPLPRRALLGIRKASLRAQRAAHLTDTQWRAAVGGIGTLLALGHLLSAVVGAVMGSAALAALAIALFICLAAIWVRLMRQPVEA